MQITARILTSLEMHLPYDPVIPLLGIYPNELNTPIQKEMCTPVMIAAALPFNSAKDLSWDLWCLMHKNP